MEQVRDRFYRSRDSTGLGLVQEESFNDRKKPLVFEGSHLTKWLLNNRATREIHDSSTPRFDSTRTLIPLKMLVRMYVYVECRHCRFS